MEATEEGRGLIMREGELYQRVYIASALANQDIVCEVLGKVRAAGHAVTYDWTEHGSLEGAEPKRCYAVAQAELAGVATATALVLVLPGGRGAHVELGAALGLGTSVLIVGTEDGAKQGFAYPCLFHTLCQSITLPELTSDEVWRAVQPWLARLSGR